MSPRRHRPFEVSFISLLICAFLVGSPLWAQRRTLDNIPERPINFSVNSNAFFDLETRKSVLVIYYKVVNDHLQFIKDDGGYRADFQVVCVVYDHDGQQVTGDEISGSQRAETYDQTNSRDTFVEGHFQFPLSPGDYQLRIWIEGQHTGEMVRAESRAEIPNFERSDLTISGLLLAHEIGPRKADQDGPNDRYSRHGLLIAPSVNHIFSDQNPQLWSYFEIYDSKSSPPFPSTYQAIYQVIDPSGQIVLDDTTSIPREEGVTGSFQKFQVSSLDENQYLLRVTIWDRVNERTAGQEAQFQIRWSALGHVAKNYKEAVEQLRYIASDEEYKKLKEAEGEARREVWLEFWKERDPTPGTPANEMRTEYYRRIEYANANFSVVSTGWRTDRGRIYIVYGPPDDIEHHPMEIGGKPYQIWHYYNTNRRFYFVDEDGYGDYRLVAWR